jgi:hypothetical protein
MRHVWSPHVGSFGPPDMALFSRPQQFPGEFSRDFFGLIFDEV